ncbi:MAG: UvrD-helicase domain-containing protein [Deltaproteobacteria bacterium]|jgi:DNA helicase-2/ATP-dependent DNA helicase PcrA|nr:UvrD-helicase domain-containing protein [Deltaproteobacteria bacterium]
MSLRFADLHIHSRHSRATSKALTPENLALWAGYKGLDLLGTGDMTHPGWLDELEAALAPGDDGFYGLKGAAAGVRFVPTGEVSAIYKQGGQTRKIHLVVVAPNLEAARRFSQTLGRLGNVTSDGRPILGLSAKNILEIALAADPAMEVVPAHIWTPWFSLFGSKSGFDSLEECFGDLSGHIRALETGLSSDPDMNRLVSALDRYALVSSSDAHSPEKLGREATALEGELTFAALKTALAGGPNLAGTVEFFPEEGKYHLDGHADCGPALTPRQTRELGGLCPVCGRPVTVGVLSRVLELADRELPPPELKKPDWHILPLPELLGQTLDRGPTSKDVIEGYRKLVGEFGHEFRVLLSTPLSDLSDFAGPILARAVEKMRLGQIEASGGYDGKFGVISVLSREERLTLGGQGLLFRSARRGRKPSAGQFKAGSPSGPLAGSSVGPALGASGGSAAVVRRRPGPTSLLAGLSDEQARAATSPVKSLAVVAGPGSGKTLTLVRRAAWLVKEGAIAPERLLLTTYTRKAAETLRARLTQVLGPEAARARTSTLHALALELAVRRRPDFRLAQPEELEALTAEVAASASLPPRFFRQMASLAKNRLEVDWPPAASSDASGSSSLVAEPAAPAWAAEPGWRRAFERYQELLRLRRWWDFDDLILEALGGAEEAGFEAVLADEFQDFSPAQLKFALALAARGGLTVIGDPCQSVYGFRGAQPEAFERLAAERPNLSRLHLTVNFRSSSAVCRAAEAVSPPGGGPPRRPADPRPSPCLVRASLPTPAAEASWVVGKIVAHLGVTDLGRGGSSAFDRECLPGLGLSDVAVLFRLRRQGQELAQALDAAGLAWQLAGEDELTSADGLDLTADKIALLTMHAAKGLEFRVVFVVGLEEGLCPYCPDERDQDSAADPKGSADSSGAGGAEGPTGSAALFGPPSGPAGPARRRLALRSPEEELLEEQRLFYVALTRAKERLYLVRARQRTLYGRRLSGRPSPFWDLPPPGLRVDWQPPRGPAPVRIKPARLF